MGPNLNNLSGANLGSNVGQDIQNLGKYATNFQTPTNSTPQINTIANTHPSNITSFFNKVGSVFSESAHMFEGATKWVGRQVSDMAKSVVEFPVGVAKLGEDAYHTWQWSQTTNEILNRFNQVNSDYQSGKINQAQHLAEIRQIGKDSLSVENKYSNLSTKTASDGNLVTKSTINLASAIITIGTAGLDSPFIGAADKLAAESAGKFLISDAAKSSMEPAALNIAKLASSPEAFAKLPAGMQNVVRSAVTDTFMNIPAGKTASEVARATSINLLVKYPIAFNYLSGTGTTVLNQMEKGNFGGAAETLAFNAGILLAGGPIGKALSEATGSLARTVTGKMFGSTSFLDTLSHGLGFAPNDIYLAIKDSPETVKAFQALEATNVNATKSAYKGAYRIINSMKTDLGDMPFKSAKEFVDNVMGWHQAQTMLHENLIKNGVPENVVKNMVVGRWTVNDARQAATEITKASADSNAAGIDARLKAWEDYKMARPNSAFANNANLDKQITNLIRNTPDNGQLAEAISNIKTQYAKYENLDSAVAKRMAELGYVPITPTSLEAPFIQGTQKITTKFAGTEAEVARGMTRETAPTSALFKGQSAGDNEFFTKAIQPTGAFGHLGSVLTAAGLSPIKAEQSVHEIFTANFAKNLTESTVLSDIKAKGEAETISKAAAKVATADTGFTKEELAMMQKQGITPDLLSKGSIVEPELTAAQQQLRDAELAHSTHPMAPTDTQTNYADVVIKKITNGINEINQRAARINFRELPVSDMRQLTTKQVSSILNITETQAKEVQAAMMDAMLQVPMSVRGIADHLLDKTFQQSFAARQYMKIQGAGRFAWNPFFKAKLAAKSEILSQMEAGGKMPSVPGVNRILKFVFPESYNKIGEVAQSLETKGFFTGGFSNEAATETALAKSSMPTQLLESQKRSIAGVVESMARKAGMPTEQFMNNFPNEVRDVSEMILHYNPKASFINSPMAKTLNFAFFPFRFNLKVTSMMARTLTRQSLVVQLGVIHGLMQAHDFLTSPEGQAWYSKNADAIGLLTYFSPLETLSTLSKFGHIGDQSVASFGELGGLPLGFLPALLNAEGMLNTNTAYINPKTGQVSPEYIPITLKAKLAVAMTTFVGSLFTYPGAVAGLPSKAGTLNKVAEGLTGASSSQFRLETPTNLTPQQKQFSDVVQQLHQTTQAGQMTNPSPATPVPQTAVPTAQPYYKKTGSSTPPAKRLKKKQEPLQLLPGQTTIGQV